MNKLAILVAFLTLNVQPSYSLELYLGSITHHLIVHDGVESQFEGKIGAGGRTILNGLVGIANTQIKGNTYVSHRVFFGENSIHKWMLGAAISWGYSKKYVDYGLIVGGYGQNHHFYHVRGIDAPALKVGSLGFLPVLGGELIVHYPLSKNMTIGFANIVTPALTNHSILLRWAPNALVPQ